MKSLLGLTLVTLLAVLLTNSVQAQVDKRIVCYHTNWSQYRNGAGKFFPENIAPFLCSHIIYSFAKLSNGHLAAYEWNDESTDWSKGLYERTIDLKKQNPNLKILLAVGGWNMASKEFSDLVHSSQARAAFVASSIDFLQRNGFDGLDLDWEYPANREGSRPTDKEYFTILVRELSIAYKSKSLMLTAAVGAGKEVAESAYDIATIAQDLDMINIMSYDLRGSWDPRTGHHSPLYAKLDENDEKELTLNIDWIVNYWVKNGTPKNKINIGVATYGRSFKLSQYNSNGLGAPASGPGNMGTFTREAGFLSYYEICQNLANGWKEVFLPDQRVPFAYGQNDWVGYDTPSSLKEKAEYIRDNGYGGAMIWALDLDDFTGQFCGQGKYPLINALRKVLAPGTINVQASTYGSTATTRPSYTTVTEPTRTFPVVTGQAYTTVTEQTRTYPTVQTSSSYNSQMCYNGDGHYADVSSDCKKYYVCFFTGTVHAQLEYFVCPPGTVFDTSIKACNYQALVTCSKN